MKVGLLNVRIVNDWRVKRLKAGLDVNSARTYLTAFKGLFKWAVEEGHLPRSLLAKLKIPEKTPQKTKKAYLESEEVDKILKHLQEKCPDLYDYFVFMINTGVRIEKALTLEWSQIQMLRHKVYIPREKNKTNTERSFKINDAVMVVLHRLDESRAFDPYVFARYNKTTLIHKFGEGTKKVWGVRVTPHVCRKTWAKNLLRGKPIVGQDGKIYWVKVSQQVVARL